MNYLIVPVGIAPPRHEGVIKSMDLIHALNQLAAGGVVVSVAAGLVAWNRLAKSGRWKNYGEAKQDPEFYEAMKKEINKGQS